MRSRPSKAPGLGDRCGGHQSTSKADASVCASRSGTAVKTTRDPAQASGAPRASSRSTGCLALRPRSVPDEARPLPAGAARTGHALEALCLELLSYALESRLARRCLGERLIEGRKALVDSGLCGRVSLQF